MLALQLAFVFFGSGLLAQNFSNYPSNPEYGKFNIKQYVVADGAQYSSTDPNLTLSMESLAANGYGQWTCSSNIGTFNFADHTPKWVFSPDQIEVNGSTDWDLSSSGIPKGWFLMENILAKPSEQYVVGSTSTHPGCQPPGIVSGGKFSNSNFPVTECKVAANLNGSVRYIGVNPGTSPNQRIDFFIDGLNTAPSSGVTADGQIDVTLAGLPNPAKNRQIVKNSIHPYIHSPALTNDGTNNHPVTNTEADYRDAFDDAMDSKYEYVVWNSGGNIYAAVILLSTGAIATTAFSIGAGIRPTVACDVRNNSSGTPTPVFYVAWISGGLVKVAQYSGNTVQNGGIKTLLATFIDPFAASTIDNWGGGATHARIVVSSVSGSAPEVSVYVLINQFTAGLDHDLILYKGLTWNPTVDIAKYVDGLLDNGGVTYPSPVSSSTYSLIGIWDKHIAAISNPYDNQTGVYKQYHCLYQPVFQNNSNGNDIFSPLMLIRGCDNGFPYAGTADTRLLLNRIAGNAILEDPVSWVAAVNQMGLHIHWRSYGSNGATPTHYYVRNNRTFDEPIEENTLVTNDCIVSDGSSSGSNNHGGTAGAMLSNNVKFTIWSDPNYGAFDGGSTISGMYWQYPGNTTANGIFLAQANIGTLTFNSSNLALTAGASNGTTTANFYTMPVCNIAKTPFTGSITINQGSTWDYYGSKFVHTSSSLWDRNWSKNELTINLNGSGSTVSNLNIHGGATFWECKALTCELSTLNILYEPNIYPIQSSTTVTTCPVVDPGNSCSHEFNETGINCPANGLLRITTSSSIDQSSVNSFIPIRDWVHTEGFEGPDVESILTNVVMIITNLNASGSSSHYSLHSTNNHYTNFQQFGNTNPGGAGAVILYDGRRCTDIAAPDKVVFYQDVFKRIQFHAYTPGMAGLEITNSTIDDLDLYPIYIENGVENGVNGCSTDNYADIKIEHNTFEHVLGTQIGGDCGAGGQMFDPAHGIFIHNFNTTGKFSEVNVNGNHFDFYAPGSGHSLPIDYAELIEAAIEFDNSTGNIMDNTVTEDLFAAGILVTSAGISSPPTTKSYLCNNTVKNQTGALLGISGVFDAGIKSDHTAGYVNLNTLDGNAMGYECDDHDAPKLVHNSIINSTLDGLNIAGSSGDRAAPDLRGIHTTPPACSTCTVFFDFAANNNILNNGTHSTDAQILLNDPNQLVNMDRLSTTPAWGSWSLNKIAQGSTGSAWLIKTENFVNGTPATFSTIPDISNNNWGGVTPGTSPPPASANFAVIYPVTPTVISPWVDSSSFFGCSGYSQGERINPKNTKTLSIPPGIDTCAYLRGFENGGNTEEQNREIYDSLRLYVELCGPKDCTVDQAFMPLDAAVQFMSNDTLRFDRYRVWLDSILFLNPSCPEYFCLAMRSVQSTYQYGKYKNVGGFAVVKYLREHHPECWDSASEKSFQKNVRWMLDHGYDTSKIPPLDSIGLGIVTQYDMHAGVSFPGSGIVLNLLSFTTNPNPFKTETTLEFTLNRMAYINLAVYDELGRLVWGNGKGSSLEAGTHTIHLDGRSLPSGTLYARISTGFGEVKTVKLIHE